MMMLPINPYSLMNPMSRVTSTNLLSSNIHGGNSSLFTEFVLKSKPYEQYMKTATTGIVDFLKSVQDMQESTRKLMQQEQEKENSSFQARTAESSDSNKVTAVASAGAASKTYEVKVNAIATSQTNSGTLLSGADSSVVSTGINEFNMTIGGKTTKVSVVISDHATNDQALTKLKDAVNTAQTGVTATVVTDKDTGNKKLELRSDMTGTDQAFEVEDIIGNAMSATGANNATTLASNASYSVNGGETQTSQSNTIVLEKGIVMATLMTPTMEAVSIRVKPDNDKVISQVKDLVSSYNAMYSRLKEAGGVMDSSIRKSMDSLVGSLTYERIGIHRHGDGTLKLNEEQFEKSLSLNFEQTTKAIGGKFGLVDRLSSAAERFNEVPASSLLNQKARQAQQFAIYQSSMQIAMSTHASGWFVNMLY
jgi:flagellar hook-associated protein 2